MDWIKNLVQVLELKLHHLFFVVVLGSLLIFLPQSALEKLGVASIVNDYQPLIGIITLSAVVLWAVKGFSTIAQKLEEKRAEKKYEKNLISYIEALSMEERILLAYCISKNRQSITVDYTNKFGGVAGQLLHKGLLEAAGGAQILQQYPFKIPNRVWKLLKKDRYLLLSEDDWESHNLSEILNQFEQNFIYR